MKKVTAAVLVVASMLSGCGPSSEAELPTAPETGSIKAPLSGGYWVLVGIESCPDLFGGPCYLSPALFPRCPQDSAGQPCATVGSSCYYVHVNQSFTEFYCQ